MAVDDSAWMFGPARVWLTLTLLGAGQGHAGRNIIRDAAPSVLHGWRTGQPLRDAKRFDTPGPEHTSSDLEQVPWW